ncbi:MAG TPA: indole-3-glycerol phosphate synthase TrpC, partial [bacterium]|nr:indole-3-glycerol phosphate synthase TrpC [bacterium]
MNILQKIVGEKSKEVLAKKERIPLSELEKRPFPERRDFKAALAQPGFSIIAEIKKKSPSEGIIREDFDPEAIARSYAENGAAAISVLTDGPFFGGSDVYPLRVKRTVALPVLRKEFILDPYQVLESRVLGADAILLLANVLGEAELRDFIRRAKAIGLDCLVEIHDAVELEPALSAGAEIIGVNNRNLKTFRVDLETSLRLKKRIPAHIVTVSESGIRGRDDLVRLRDAGFDAALVGTVLMRAGDVGGR